VVSRAHYEAVRNFLAPFGIPQLQPTAKRKDLAGSKETWAKPDINTLRKFKALAGIYQILRPSSIITMEGGRTKTSRYVLEAMAIEVDERRRRANFLMFSRSQSEPKFLYTGPFYVSYRYAHSLIHRQHEENNQGFAMRAVAMYVGEDANHRPSVPCISGILLRGVAATTPEAGTRAISTPFIGIKTDPNGARFRSATLSPAVNELKWLNNDCTVLLGTLKNPEGAILQFCDRLFPP
jgi:hypothetical protein